MLDFQCGSENVPKQVVLQKMKQVLTENTNTRKSKPFKTSLHQKGEIQTDLNDIITRHR